jgi:hypothetical protein
MPSKSKKQHNLMAAVANNPKFAKKVGIPQSVGEDYVEADKGRKFRSGGMAGCGTKRMNVGGKVGMHKMPDGTMMKDSEHKMAMGGMAMGAGKGYKVEGGKDVMVCCTSAVCTKGKMVAWYDEVPRHGQNEARYV